MDRIGNVARTSSAVASPPRSAPAARSTEPADAYAGSVPTPDPTPTVRRASSRANSVAAHNPQVGTKDTTPRLSAGALQSPRFLGTEAEYFKEARGMIDNAAPGDRLCLQMYTFENAVTHGDDNAAKTAPGYADQQALLPGLAAAAKRGVKVDIVLDASRDPQTGKPHNQPIIDYLKKHAGATGNMAIDYYPPESVNIDHAKQLIHLTPDSKGGYAVQKALVGGSNWGNHTPANDDGGGVFYGRDAVGAAQIFFRDQAFSRGDRTSAPAPENDPSAPVKWLTTSPTAEGGGSHAILDAKLALTKQASSVYVNEFCFTHGDLVDATAAKGHDAHVRLDPNESMVNRNALWAVRKAHGEAQWANTAADPNMVGQKNHQKLDVYADADGQAFSLTIGSANDTSNGLDTTHAVVSKSTGASSTKKTNHEIDAQVDRVTIGDYTTADFLDAALAKTKDDLAARSLNGLPSTLSGTKPGQF
ncbi:MAG: hypothetical protein EB084_04840 [Proteobacteria bacterium]|nr:hypothetical protein [Pseudomonadota bacterium]